MAKHTLEAILSRYTADTTRESNVGDDKDIDQASAVMPARPSLRSAGARRAWSIGPCVRVSCSKPLRKSRSSSSKEWPSQLNRSTEGMLLLMGRAPLAKQLIEVYTPRSRWSRTANVFEARWTRPVRVESHGNLYLVGCRRTFGPCHYLSF